MVPTPAAELAELASRFLGYERQGGSFSQEAARHATREMLADRARELGIPETEIEAAVDAALAADKISRSAAMTVKNENENPPHDPETGEINPLRAEAEKLFAGGVTVEIEARPGSLLDRVGAELEKFAPGQVTRNATIGGDEMPPIPDFLRRVPA